VIINVYLYQSKDKNYSRSEMRFNITLQVIKEVAPKSGHTIVVRDFNDIASRIKLGIKGKRDINPVDIEYPGK
jgi:hypothetical protein